MSSDNKACNAGINPIYYITTTSIDNTPWGGSVTYKDPCNDQYANSMSTVDSDGNIKLRKNNIHIQPIDNGFLLTLVGDDGIENHCFEDYDKVIDFLSDNAMLNKTMERVADNV